MRISVLTLFPEMFDALKHSIIGRALEENKFILDIHNIRDYSKDKHLKCDDYAFGGGCGMVMTPQPIFDCINAIDPERRARRVYLSPKGRRLGQDLVTAYAGLGHLILLCGHYEGVDQRVIDLEIDEELSIGDYVLTGGELAAMVVIDGIARYLPGVLGSEQSTDEESFSNGLLEYPQYTRPQTFNGLSVPEVLTSGHHGNVKKWRLEQSVTITKKMRKDLYRKFTARNGKESGKEK
ncbi:MAG: tRNA (guanosine(37)-N1)-methyltransferase TrmD [Clostridiales bacterium]|jgi:tRNA (guanine37-N1)-methyltransferase|nr:tRNA (guanosine(37)-N1)-methyltransferase TrmD [Clostridiales bacterium]